VSAIPEDERLCPRCLRRPIDPQSRERLCFQCQDTRDQIRTEVANEKRDREERDE